MVPETRSELADRNCCLKLSRHHLARHKSLLSIVSDLSSVNRSVAASAGQRWGNKWAQVQRVIPTASPCRTCPSCRQPAFPKLTMWQWKRSTKDSQKSSLKSFHSMFSIERQTRVLSWWHILHKGHAFQNIWSNSDTSTFKCKTVVLKASPRLQRDSVFPSHFHTLRQHVHFNFPVPFL